MDILIQQKQVPVNWSVFAFMLLLTTPDANEVTYEKLLSSIVGSSANAREYECVLVQPPDKKQEKMGSGIDHAIPTRASASAPLGADTST